MKKIRIFIAYVLLAGCVSLSWAQVNISIAEFSVTRGDTIAIPLIIENNVSSYEIISYKIDLTFQNSVLKPIDVDNQGTMSESWFSPGLYAGTPGKVEIGAYGGGSLSGSGTLTKVIFEAIGDYGDTTGIRFDGVTFNDNQPTANTSDGFLSIKLKPVTVTVTTSIGSKASVIVDGETHIAPFTASWYPGTEHTLSIDSQQSGGEGIKYHFISWSDDGERTHTVAPTTNSTYIAFMSTEYFLELNSTHGNPVGEGWYPEGDSVTIFVESLVAGSTGTQYVFAGWIGDGVGAYTGSVNPFAFQLLGPITETASWKTQHYLTVNTLPENLTTISGSGWYDENASATTGTAPQTIIDGEDVRKFRGWKLDGAPVDGNPVSITMDKPHTASADYALELSIEITTDIGAGTRVMIDGELVDAPASVVWTADSEHSIGCPEFQNEKDSQRLSFDSWSDGGAREHTVKPNTNTIYIAKLKTEYQVVVNTAPPGISEITGAGWYDVGASASIGPAPQTVDFESKSYSFLNWIVDSLESVTNPLTVVVDTSRTIIARYLQNLYITGRITFQDEAVPNVKMLLSGSMQDTAVTDENGKFYFEGLIPGSYKIVPEAGELGFKPGLLNFNMLLFSMKDQNFVAEDITSPEVKVLAPDGGENLVSGQSDSIRWQASDNIELSSVSLYYSIDMGATWTLIQNVDPMLTSCHWIVPDVNSTECLVKVKAKDTSENPAEDVSDATFTITNNSAVMVESGRLPTAFYVHQSYPNPFNPSTEIEFGLKTGSHVLLQIFNVYGQEIETLIDGYQNAGSYRIQWNATDDNGVALPSGIYFYRIRAGADVKSHRMILMR
ncbi:T9SS type A sorting domain-containing protein [candidate division KSB1 bacterium]|nr:T9SS type A sorting domain-containing protein [candidate division KSB1 bacterium]